MTTGHQRPGNLTAVIHGVKYAESPEGQPYNGLPQKTGAPGSHTAGTNITLWPWDLANLDVEPGHTGIQVYHAPSGLSTVEDLPGQGPQPQTPQSMVCMPAHCSWDPNVSPPTSGIVSLWWHHYGAPTLLHAARGELALSLSSKGQISGVLKCDSRKFA